MLIVTMLAAVVSGLAGSVGLAVVLKMRRENESLVQHLEEVTRRVEAQGASLSALQGTNEIKFQQLCALMARTEPLLDPEASQWILKSGAVEKFFQPGRLTSVSNSQDSTDLQYEYTDEGRVVCSHYCEGSLRARTEFSKHGAPLKGTYYGQDGSVVDEYLYDELGQVAKVEKD
ncbi:MAG: hypothetical protein HN742_26835 [Lentisphaerae bacterium]|jgi:YD repeat-containing protein|nr:hypothetical protein [Lentisphaerota bacterium]MBT7914822.1 hypothetical protein [Candidatus Bathyarchaeota archaeon]MBT4823025.1 hypothetical protein [Lentisphaerota bacterium]MBT5611391.1 hypothetical protein [Lentisphaerota bacterium]MBT7057046.1 hypothetical protein [Lentisphaerota bacterium]